MLTQGSGMAEGVAPGLRPDAESVRARADADARAQAARCACRSHRPRRRTGPRARASCRRRRRRPCRATPSGMRQVATTRRVAKRDDADRARVAIGDVEIACVAARVEAVRAGAGGDEPAHAKRTRVDQPDAATGHVGDVERPAVGRELDVLRHRCRSAQAQHARDALGVRRRPRPAAPENSQLASSSAPSAVKSMWSTPRHGTASE